jgi:ribonuclease HII
MPDLSFERASGGLVCGVDEVGRGPLAGPVVAAAVVLDLDHMPAALKRAIDDSKVVPADERRAIHAELPRCALIGIGAASVAEIERFNILRASLTAMRRAVLKLGITPDAALVDGNQKPLLPCAVTTVVDGDAKSLSIAAASIAAKVTRDALMADLALCHPGYGWEHNAGYGTQDHREAIRSLGLTPHHRRKFGFVRWFLGDAESESPELPLNLLD